MVVYKKTYLETFLSNQYTSLEIIYFLIMHYIWSHFNWVQWVNSTANVQTGDAHPTRIHSWFFVSEPESESISESKSQAISEPEIEPISEPVSEPVSEHKSESISEPVC